MVLNSPSSGVLPTALWVVPVADLGGVARHVLDVAKVGLPGWNLAVVCPEGALADRLRTLGTRVISGRFGSDAGFIASAGLLRSAIQRTKPAVVHSHLSYADVICAWVLAAKPNLLLVTTEHGIAADDLVYHGSALRSRLKARLHQVRLRRADVLIAVSEATRRAMIAKWHPVRAIQVIPNGVAATANLSWATVREGASNGPHILSLSRLSPEKGIPVLFAVFATIKQTHNDATLTIAGTGPQKDDLVALVRRLGLEEAVTFVGFVDPQVAMRSADVLVQLSVWENCSYTILDAIAERLGVVATPVGGNPEILPPQCLVVSHDTEAIEKTIMDQAANVDRRPNLPAGWPDVSAMVQKIVGCYVPGTLH